MFKILLTFLIAANSVSSFADAPNAERLKKGDKASFDGVELSDSYIKEVYKEINEVDHLKLINESLEKSITFYQDNEKLYLKEVVELKDQNTSLDIALNKANSNSFWVKAMWFTIGVIVTGSIGYVESKR